MTEKQIYKGPYTHSRVIDSRAPSLYTLNVIVVFSFISTIFYYDNEGVSFLHIFLIIT